MKTITPKDAFKLFLFLLILFSAKAFSFTRLPNDENSTGSGSRIGYVSKAKDISKTPSKTSSTVSKSNAKHALKK